MTAPTKSMFAVENLKGFWHRVNYAHLCIVTSRGIGSRRFDAIFEIYDGDVVVAALMRRAEENQRLREGISAMFAGKGPPKLWHDCHKTFAECPKSQLAHVAREIRRRKAIEWKNHLTELEAAGKPAPAIELTEIGEQHVIPGCERATDRGPAQLGLWD